MPGHHGLRIRSPSWYKRLLALVKRPSRPKPRPGSPESPQISLLMGHARHSHPCENESPMNAAIPERRPATEEISGLVERVTFHNDESGFCVLRVKARGQRDETTVIGSLLSVTLRAPNPLHPAMCDGSISWQKNRLTRSSGTGMWSSRSNGLAAPACLTILNTRSLTCSLRTSVPAHPHTSSVRGRPPA